MCVCCGGTHLQVDGGGDPHVKADVHLCRDDIVGHSSVNHGHVHSGHITQCEALTDIQPVAPLHTLTILKVGTCHGICAMIALWQKLHGLQNILTHSVGDSACAVR